MKRTSLYFLGLALLSAAFAEERIDLYTINRIKAEAFQNSKVMENAFYLTDVYGPRLTGSPNIKAAAEWAVKRFSEWRLSDPHLEKWGPFGRGWSNIKFRAELKEPGYMPLLGVPRPWSPGTHGPVAGEAVLAPLAAESDFAKYKGKLKGKIVLISAVRQLTPMSDAPLRRFSDAELAQEALAPDPSLRSPFTSPIPREPGAPAARPYNREAANRFRNQLAKFLADEGVLVSVATSSRTDGGTIFATAAGSRDEKDPVPPPSVALTSEHYNRIARLLEKKVPVHIEFDIENKYFDADKDAFNVLASIPGGARKDELVMLGAHLDSWTFGTGATDNAAGCAAIMEAARILKALDLKMPRTVRVALWTGEENGLLGSKAYVKDHFADPEVMKPKPEHARVSGYFNLDNGTGKIRGAYLQGNDMMRPVFESWFAPFKDLGAGTVTIRNTSGTDHLSFDAVGLPGFQFIQDPVEYSTRTHHSNMDVYDRLVPGDLMQASAIIASVVYHAATRPEMLPRKPLPKPQPARRDSGAAPEPTPSGDR